MMRFTYFVLPLAFAGCTTAAQEKVAVIKQGMAQIKTNLNTCRATIDTDPKYGPVFVHIPLSQSQMGQSSLAQLTDETVPTLGEATLVAQYRDATAVCREQYVAGLMQLDSGVGEAYETAQMTVGAVFVPLVERQETWGAANRALMDAKMKGESLIHQAAAGAVAQLNAENREELARRAAIVAAIGAAAGAAAQYNENERLINAIAHR